jgi:flavin reductase (DIM6/NTAB) family NADH-FMN oxidoreductase RutF
MSEQHTPPGIVPVPTDGPIWPRIFTVAPLVLVATREPGGGHDIAPKHMAMPIGWQNYFGFVCSRRHATQRNAEASRAFTVGFPRPEQIVEIGQAAAPREADATKPALAALPTIPTSVVDGVLVAGCSLHLECVLDRIVDGFGENSLVVGRIVAAAADPRALRDEDRDDADLIHELPPLVYLSPGRFAAVHRSLSFPYPVDFRL